MVRPGETACNPRQQMKSSRSVRKRHFERMYLRTNAGARVRSSKEARSTAQVGWLSLKRSQVKPAADKSRKRGSYRQGARTLDGASVNTRRAIEQQTWYAEPRLKVFVLKSPVRMTGPPGT